MINFPFSSLFKSFGAVLLAVGTGALYVFVKKSGREEIEKEYLESQIEEVKKREETNKELQDEYKKIGSKSGFYDEWQAGNDPAGITTQDEKLASRLDPKIGGEKLANYLKVLTLEAQTLARACGKSHIRNLEPEDLNALTLEASAMARVPLAGTDWIPGK